MSVHTTHATRIKTCSIFTEEIRHSPRLVNIYYRNLRRMVAVSWFSDDVLVSINI